MKAIKLLVVLVVAVMLVGTPAVAGIGVTDQRWDFSDNSNPAIPEYDNNPFGVADATITSTASGPPPEWLANTLGRDGVWTAEGRLEVGLSVPNQMVENPYKEIIIEIGFYGDLNGFAIYTDPFGGNVQLVNRTIVDSADGWTVLTDEYRIEPNPFHEWINYHWLGDLVGLDYIKLSTKCVPEPLTIALLGLGGLMLRRKRNA